MVRGVCYFVGRVSRARKSAGPPISWSGRGPTRDSGHTGHRRANFHINFPVCMCRMSGGGAGPVVVRGAVLWCRGAGGPRPVPGRGTADHLLPSRVRVASSRGTCGVGVYKD
jgi:hypothetical protein